MGKEWQKKIDKNLAYLIKFLISRGLLADFIEEYNKYHFTSIISARELIETWQKNSIIRNRNNPFYILSTFGFSTIVLSFAWQRTIKGIDFWEKENKNFKLFFVQNLEYVIIPKILKGRSDLDFLIDEIKKENLFDEFSEAVSLQLGIKGTSLKRLKEYIMKKSNEFDTNRLIIQIVGGGFKNLMWERLNYQDEIWEKIDNIIQTKLRTIFF